jgi:hypothetical protein
MHTPRCLFIDHHELQKIEGIARSGRCFERLTGFVEDVAITRISSDHVFTGKFGGHANPPRPDLAIGRSRRGTRGSTSGWAGINSIAGHSLS